jgi:hypothetical protein
MQTRLGQVQNQLSTQNITQTIPKNGNKVKFKEIPDDYVATFTLKGERGNRVEDVINISVDGAFVGVAIGYSFIPAKIDLKNPNPNQPPANSNIARLLKLTGLSIDERLLVQCLVNRYCGIDFKYSIVDSATGRELQNKPIHNIAGLGEPSGERPFRQMPKPIRFEPRSTIRIVVEEMSEGLIYIGAELFIVFHGYKILSVGT